MLKNMLLTLGLGFAVVPSQGAFPDNSCYLCQAESKRIALHSATHHSSTSSIIAPAPNGMIYLWDPSRRTAICRFTSAGRHDSDVLLSVSGERLHVNAMAVGVGDTLFISDAANRSILIQPPGGRHCRVPVSVQIHENGLQLLPNGDFLVNGVVRFSRSDPELFLHIVTREGRVRSSFSPSSVHWPDRPMDTIYRLTSSSDDLWAVNAASGAVWRMSLTGSEMTRIGTLDNTMVVGRSALPFTPMVMDVRLESDTTLAILVRVERSSRAPAQYMDAIRNGLPETGKWWRGLIYTMDIRSGRIIQRQVIPFYALRFAGSQLIVANDRNSELGALAF